MALKTTVREWLLIFYSVPSRPVSNRMKIWRKLAKAGAVQLKGAVYILPDSEEHEEFFHWLLGEVKAMGGDGAFVRVSEIKAMAEGDISELFLRQAGKEYRGLERHIDALERKVQSVKKGTTGSAATVLSGQFLKLKKEFEAARERDFFGSPAGGIFLKRIRVLEGSVKSLEQKRPSVAVRIEPKRASDYQGRTWATRKNPFVDRMASAWLIKKFIDPKASFKFMDERDLAKPGDKTISFDVRGGEFTHAGDLCTFEVLVKSFGIKDKAVRRLAEIVHDIDVKDEKYKNPETAGLEEILTGIHKSFKNDDAALEQGMRAFEMMYLSKTNFKQR